MNIIFLISIAISIEIVASKFHKQLTADEHRQVFGLNQGTVKSEDYELVPVMHDFEYNSNEIDGEPWHPKVEIKAFKKNFTLYLEPNDHVLFGRNTPIFRARRTRTTQGTYKIEYTRKVYSLPKKIQLYHDRENGAAVTAYADSQNNRLHIRGLIGDGRHIRPIPKAIHKKYFGDGREAYMFQSHPNGYSIDNDPSATHHILMKVNHNNWFDRVQHNLLHPSPFDHESNGFGGSFSDGFHSDFSKNFDDTFPFGRPSFLHDPFFSIKYRDDHDQDPSNVFQNVDEPPVPFGKHEPFHGFWDHAKPIDPLGLHDSDNDLDPSNDESLQYQTPKPTRKPKRKSPRKYANDDSLAPEKRKRKKVSGEQMYPGKSKGKRSKKDRDDYKPSPPSVSPEIYDAKRKIRRPKTAPESVSPALKAKSQVQDEKKVVYPEILVVVDHATFEAHNEDLEELCLYMAAFWNAVDLRYRELQDPRVRLNIAGIIVPEEPEGAPYLELHRIGSDSIDSSMTLDSMGKHFSKPGYPCNFDLVMAITHRTLDAPRVSRDSSGNTFTTSTAGLAKVGGTCQIESGQAVGIINDNSDFKGILSAAHELAHLLGAPHDKKKEDGYRGGLCDWDHGYLMSYNRENSNAFHWSPCSKKTMKNFFESEDGTCLWNKPDPGEPLPKFLPGKLLNRNKQCEISKGPGFKANETSSALADCVKLECVRKSDTHEGTLTEFGPTNFSPAEGTFCGDASICLDGLCVLDPKEEKNS